MPICVTLETGEESHLEGRHPNADPRAPLYWLAEFLRSKGQGLQAGQAVITGSYAGSFDVPLEQQVAIRYGALGVLKVRFTER
jgi:2-keto-4-pentenoate hydratase